MAEQMAKGDVLEVSGKTSLGSSIEKKRKVLVVPSNFDGVCAAPALSRLFGAHPLFVNSSSAERVRVVLSACRAKELVPVVAGISVADESFFGESGILIEHSRGGKIRGGGRTSGYKTVVEGRSLCGAVLRLFSDTLFSGEKEILRSAGRFLRMYEGERGSEGYIENGFFLASGLELCGRSFYSFLKENPDVLLCRGGSEVLEDRGGEIKDGGTRAAIAKHLENQREAARLALLKPSLKKTWTDTVDVYRAQPGMTRLGILLALLDERKNGGPALFLTAGKDGERVCVGFVPGATEEDYRRHGIETRDKGRPAAVREVFLKKKSTVTALVLAMEKLALSLKKEASWTAAMELGGLEKGI